MKNLRILVAMQLKEKMNFKGNRYSLKEKILKLGLALLKFISISGLCYLILFLCVFLKVFNVGIIPSSVLVFIFGIMMFLSIISSSIALMKNLYYSRENQLLLTFPCNPRQVFTSKILVFYIYEFIRNLSFLVPLFIAFGLVNKYPFIYYPWVFISFILVSLIPILFGVVISLPLAAMFNKFRQYKRIQFSLLCVLVVIATYGVLKLVSIIPSDIDIINNWVRFTSIVNNVLEEFSNKIPFIKSLTKMIVGERYFYTINIFYIDTLFTLLKTIFLCLCLFVISMFIIMPFFYKMASKPFEFRKRIVKEKANKKRNFIFSILKTEFTLSLREPSRIFTCVILLIVLPVSILLLNTIFNAMNVRRFGEIISISFNLLMILLISLNSNYYAASVFSKDGRSSYLLKVQPSKYQTSLLAKLAFNSTFIIVGFIITFFVLLNKTYLGLVRSLLLILICLFCYLAHLFYSAQLDITNPKTELYNNTSHPDSNENENKSTIVAFVIAFVVFGVMLFLLSENFGNFTYIKICVLTFIVMIYRLYLLLNNIELYYAKR